MKARRVPEKGHSVRQYLLPKDLEKAESNQREQGHIAETKLTAGEIAKTLIHLSKLATQPITYGTRRRLWIFLCPRREKLPLFSVVNERLDGGSVMNEDAASQRVCLYLQNSGTMV
jgi:hypothetical protein